MSGEGEKRSAGPARCGSGQRTNDSRLSATLSRMISSLPLETQIVTPTVRNQPGTADTSEASGSELPARHMPVFFHATLPSDRSRASFDGQGFPIDLIAHTYRPVGMRGTRWTLTR